MKCISKTKEETRDYALNIIRERNFLYELKHPFVLKLRYAFQTPTDIYMIIDFLQGGDLFFHLNKKGFFSEKMARFYGS